MQELKFDVTQFANDLKDEWLDNIFSFVEPKSETIKNSPPSSSDFEPSVVPTSPDQRSTICEQSPKKKRKAEPKSDENATKRRDRLNEKLEELKELLPFLGNAAQALKKKKITKETVLLDTIEYIQLLKNNVRKTIRIEDPFVMKFTQPEIDAGFNIMYKCINQGMFSVTNVRALNNIEEETHKLVDLALNSENKEHLLLAFTTKIILSSSIVYIPSKVIEYCEKALPIYNSLSPSRKSSVVSIFGSNIGCIIYIVYAVALGRMCRYDRSREQLQQAIKLAQTLNHTPSLQCVYSTMQQYKGTRGEFVTLQESSAMIKNLGSNVWWKPFGDLALASSIVEYSDSFIETNEAHKLLVNAIDSVIAKFGSLTELTVRISALKTWKKVDIKTGLMHATALLDQVEKTGITGAWTRADLLTRTAELLLWKPEENAIVREFTELEAKSMLNTAYKEAMSAESYSTAIGAMMMLSKLMASRGEWEEYEQTLHLLALITASVQRHCLKEKPALLVEATSLLTRNSVL